MSGRFTRIISASGPMLCLVALPAPAAAQAVTLSDLEGQAVEAEVLREQVGRRQGQTSTARLHQSWKLSINADKSVEMTVSTTRHGSDGTRKAKPSSGLFKLDEVKELPSSIGGEGVWRFEDGSLSFIRTFPSGAYRAMFAFTRGPAGLTCTVGETFARENGRGEIRILSPFAGGGEVTLVSTKQLSSSCTVTKKQAP